MAKHHSKRQAVAPRAARQAAKAREARERVTLSLWAQAVRSKHLRALWAHPHHYAVAGGLTAFLFLTGHFEAGAALGAWGYALLENLATVVEA